MEYFDHYFALTNAMILTSNVMAQSSDFRLIFRKVSAEEVAGVVGGIENLQRKKYIKVSKFKHIFSKYWCYAICLAKLCSQYFVVLIL